MRTESFQHAMTLEEFGPRRQYEVELVLDVDVTPGESGFRYPDGVFYPGSPDEADFTVHCTRFVSERVDVLRDSSSEGWFGLLDRIVQRHLDARDWLIEEELRSRRNAVRDVGNASATLAGGTAVPEGEKSCGAAV